MCYLIQELVNMQAVKEAEIPQGAICQTIPEVQLKEAGNQLTERERKRRRGRNAKVKWRRPRRTYFSEHVYMFSSAAYIVLT